ncbi:interferon-induced protein 44-like [Engraulis encrasicolus]|uniref:interferon-induced protein 44-like n=1 Tax=Engraulis encrasicolus TaxID=184585 RepID=UPI002FD01206
MRGRRKEEMESETALCSRLGLGVVVADSVQTGKPTHSSAMGSSPSQPQLQDQNVKRGGTITFTWRADCEATATWSKNGQLLSGKEDRRVTIRHDNLNKYLTITDAREEDEGRYTLELQNGSGKASGSANVKLLEYDSDWRNLDWKTSELKKKLGSFTLSNPQINHLRFLLHGPVGHGKSSIINSFNSVFQGRVTEKAQSASYSGNSFTLEYQTYQVKDTQGRTLPFVFNDSMGLETLQGAGVLTDDIIAAIQGHVKDGYKFKRSPLRKGDKDYNRNPILSDQVHCLVSVIRGDRFPLLEDDDNILEKMRTVRRAASDLGIPQVVIMTYVDLCCPLVNKDLRHIYSSKAIHRTMQRSSKKLGVPMNHIFPVKNYHQETKVDNKTDCVILEALEKITHLANDYVENKTHHVKVSPLKIAGYIGCAIFGLVCIIIVFGLVAELFEYSLYFVIMLLFVCFLFRYLGF